MVLSTVHFGPPKGLEPGSRGPTVLLDNRETRPSVICQPVSFGGINWHLVLRVRQHQIDSMDGLNEVDLHPSQRWESRRVGRLKAVT